MQLSLRQLEVFLRVAEFGSFSEAAKALHVSQPALTRTIQQTEATLGARLFDRNTRKVELTRVGVDILPIAQHILGEFRTACSQMSQSIERLNGRVNVAAPPSIAAALLPPIIALFVRNHPDAEVRISELRSACLTNPVAEGACDFGLASKPPKTPHILYRELFSEDMFMICRDDDPIASGELVPWSIFATRPFISMVRGCSIRTIAEEAFSSLNLEVKTQYECEHLSTMRSLISAGLGISAISSSMFQQIGFENTAARLLIEPSLIRSVGVVTCSGRPLSTIAEEFLKIVVLEVPRLRNAVISDNMIKSLKSGRVSRGHERTLSRAQLCRPREISRQQGPDPSYYVKR